MSENLRRYVSCVYSFDAVVQRVSPAQWDEQSKCSEWTNRQVAGHVTWTQRRFAGDLGREDWRDLQPMPEAEVAGENPAAAWSEARDAVLFGLDKPGALKRMVDTPFGQMPTDMLLGILGSDLFAHTWDIGSATGIDPALDPATAELFFTGLAAAGDSLRGPGMMGPAIEVPADADPVTRYLAISGRQA